MKQFQIISKPNCSRCEQLKQWLKQENLPYEEWSLDDPDIKIRLLDDDKFVEKFCDIDGCMVYTPVMRINDTGEYITNQIFGIDGVRGKYIKEVLGIA